MTEEEQKTHPDELLSELLDELLDDRNVHFDPLELALACAADCETLKDFVGNLTEAIQNAQYLATALQVIKTKAQRALKEKSL